MYGYIDEKVERLISNNVDTHVRVFPINGKIPIQSVLLARELVWKRISSNLESVFNGQN